MPAPQDNDYLVLYSPMKHYLILTNEAIMALLALGSGALLIFEETRTVTPEQLELIEIIDISIAFVFLAEFFGDLYVAKDRKHFFKTHWWELLACIPITNPETQTLRLLRLVKVLKVLKVGAHIIITEKSIVHTNQVKG